MKRNQPLSVLAVLFLAAMFVSTGCQKPTPSGNGPDTPGATAGKNSAPKTPAPIAKLKARFQTILIVLELDENEKIDLQRVHDENLQELQEWYAENGPAMRSIQGEAITAFKDRDLQRLKSMNARGDKEKIAKLKDDERKILSKYETALYNTIPESQFLAWKAHTIAANLIDFLSSLDLMQDQINEIHASSRKVIEQIGDEPNWAGYGTVQLENIFEQDIVSGQQKSVYEALKKKNPLRMMNWNNH